MVAIQRQVAGREFRIEGTAEGADDQAIGDGRIVGQPSLVDEARANEPVDPWNGAEPCRGR